jgi:hypothetical protein
MRLPSLISLFLFASLPIHALDYVWWEGEAPKAQSGELKDGHVFNSPNPKLSGGKSLGGTGKAGTFVEYEIQSPKEGEYFFYARKFWHHGPFQFKWNGEGEWRKVANTPLLDSVDLAPHCVNWVPCGKVKLKKGANALRLEAVEPYGPFVFDCFVVTSSQISPNGTLKPGEKYNLADPGTWAFEPDVDEFKPDALNLRALLNEKIAGENGYLAVNKEGDFVDGKGKVVRIWAVNTGVQNEFDLDGIRQHAKALAKRGVNMVRHHGHLNPEPNEPIGKPNEKQIDVVQRLVAAMKDEGIYTTFSPFWATSKGNASWGIAGHGGGELFTLLFWDETLQGAYKGWIKELLTRPNPYEKNKTPLAKDPAFAVFQIQNEDSLFFWTTSGFIKGEKEKRLTAKYHAWRQANGLPGTPALNFRFWEMGTPTQDHKDTMRFFAETMRAWNQSVEKFLREECGCKAVVNAGNWRTADQVKLLDLERYSYDVNAVIGVNRYVNGGFGGESHVNPREGHKAGYMIENGDFFQDASVLLQPDRLATCAKQVAGRAYIISESTWVPPMSTQAEGPFLVAAHGSLTGVDAYYWFATGQIAYDATIAKWQFACPSLLGGFPAASVLLRKGLVQRGKPVVHEERALDDLWNLRPPVIAEEGGYDANRDSQISPQSAIKGGVDPLAYLAGPVEVVYGGDPAKSTTADLKTLIDKDAKKVTSVTKELVFDYGTGLCTLNAPAAQGATGFLAKAGTIALKDLKIESKMEYGAILAVALDAKPLRESRKILLQVTARCRPNGWKQSEASYQADKKTWQGFRIDSKGGAPWNVANTDVTLTLAGPAARKVTRLDENLYPTADKVEAKAGAGGVVITPPANAMYLLVE